MREVFMAAVLWLLLFIPSIHFCQAADQISDESNNRKHAISFYLVDGYEAAFQFGNRDGIYSKVLLNLSFSGSDGTSDMNHEEYSIVDTSSFTINEDVDESSFSCSLSYLFMCDFIKTKLAAFYFGAGPYFIYSYNSVSTFFTNNNENSTDWGYENSSNNYSFGAKAIIGIESYLSDNVFFFAETQLNGGKNWYDR